MIQLIRFLKRRPGMDRDAFHDYWLLHCRGPLIRDTGPSFRSDEAEDALGIRAD